MQTVSNTRNSQEEHSQIKQWNTMLFHAPFHTFVPLFSIFSFKITKSTTDGTHSALHGECCRLNQAGCNFLAISSGAKLMFWAWNRLKHAKCSPILQTGIHAHTLMQQWQHWYWWNQLGADDLSPSWIISPTLKRMRRKCHLFSVAIHPCHSLTQDTTAVGKGSQQLVVWVCWHQTSPHS